MFVINPISLVARISVAMQVAAMTAEAMEITAEEIAYCTPEEVALVLEMQLAHLAAVSEIIVCTEVLSN